MLSAYVDDSGKEDQFAALFGGIIFPTEKLEAFSKRWRRVLRRYGLSEYHCSKMGNLTENLRRKRRQQLNVELLQAIPHLYGKPIAARVEYAVFERAKSLYGLIGDAQLVAFEAVLQAFRKASAEEFGSQSFKLVIDNSPGLAGRIGEIVNGFRSEYPGVLDAWIFGNRKEHEALQAADLIACELFRFNRDEQDGITGMALAKLRALQTQSCHEIQNMYPAIEDFEKAAEDLKNGETFFALKLRK